MPFPKDITYTMNVRDTADFTALSIDPGKPFELGDKIWANKPFEHQFLSYIMANGTTKPTKNHLFGHQEKASFPNWVEYTGATETSQGTSNLEFEDATLRLYSGHRLFNPDTEEIMRVTTIGSTAGQVTTTERNYGRGSAADYLTKGQRLLILPPNFAQGFTVGSGITGGKVYKQFSTSIVDWPVALTRTEASEVQVGGDPFQEQLADQWEAATHQMESELMFGAAKTDNTGSEPVHVTKGLMDWVQTNVWVADGVLSRMDLFDILMEWDQIAKEGGVIACASQFIWMVSNMANNLVTVRQDESTLGMAISFLKTPKREIPMMEVEALSEHPTLWGWAFLVPKGHVDYRPLNGILDNDVRYEPIKRDEVMRQEGHITGEYGWEYFLEEKFGLIKGIEF